ncbi:PREDICTED: monocarboxylate transporter 12-B-like [Papilio polytes]|uniref:monocarboxylate transporter 12-B-like n=1 Tax=Papilio polytes TaxID=76194 RepID=UPI000675D640|nr:PREDICTED: monocarboxylate transporter 12-B-like [Papilio polytes]XP_013135004.1 PREDICTED: monocarboxylate transporter 12-B-like [Papilio polytes]
MSNRNSMMAVPRVEKRLKLVPPDGGWGWMVVAGAALSNIFNQSMLSLFSLLYGDALEAMGHNTKGAAIVLSTMLFTTNFGGPIAGAIIKLTSTRFVAVLGACSCTLGILLSGFSTNIWHLVITYGIFLGFGLGFIQNSSFVAINSYFKLRKSRAVGLANVGTGIGQTVMPHVVRYLLENYGFRGACMLLGSLSLHGIGGTLLIQPVAWHMKKVEEEVVIDEKIQLLEDKHKNIVIDKDHKVNGESIYQNGSRISNNERENGLPMNGKNSSPNQAQHKSIFRKIYELFDMSLLLSPRFINIIIGTALTVTSIQNFSLIFPIFLQKVASLDKQQTANCMSAVAIADIIGRLTLPVFQDKYRIKARMMIILTSIWLIVVRQVLAYQSDLTVLLVLSCLYGFGRSMVIVARNIAISENCRLDQVPAAVGLGMLSMGMIVPPTGYFLGWIRDYTGSFIVCISAQNALLVAFLIMWVPDMIMIWFEERRRKKKNVDVVEMS